MSNENNQEDFFRMWSTDKHGNRVVVGLTLEETTEYLAFREDCLAGKFTDNERRDRWIELHDKHEMATCRRHGGKRGPNLKVGTELTPYADGVRFRR